MVRVVSLGFDTPLRFAVFSRIIFIIHCIKRGIFRLPRTLPQKQREQKEGKIIFLLILNTSQDRNGNVTAIHSCTVKHLSALTLGGFPYPLQNTPSSLCPSDTRRASERNHVRQLQRKASCDDGQEHIKRHELMHGWIRMRLPTKTALL